MKLVPFKKSLPFSIGVELELQIINPRTFTLISRAKDLIRAIRQSDYQDLIKPEVTQSMIEINSQIHQNPQTLLNELETLHQFLQNEGKKLDVLFSGGGTHPFQKWTVLKIFPSQRFKKLNTRFRYLSKHATVFGQHIHIGCKDANDALYLTHCLARYVPQLIALSASSPYYQGVDTGFQSTRSNIFIGFPFSGVIPLLTDWKVFSTYYYRLKNLKIITSMKDFYWDVRPKPEFGTVEVRVCDTPLTIKKAVLIAAYLQTLCHYLLREKPLNVNQDLYFLYSYNRFQAGRYGLAGQFIDSKAFEPISIGEDILQTISAMEKDSNELGNGLYLSQLANQVVNRSSDADTLRQLLKSSGSITKLVEAQCNLWTNSTS